MDTIAGPYKIMTLAPFSPLPEGRYNPVFYDVDIYSLDEILEKMAPVLYLPLSLEDSSQGAVTLELKKMADFRPNRIAQQVPAASAPASPAPEQAEKTASGPASSSAVDDILSMVETPDTKPAGRPPGPASGHTSGPISAQASAKTPGGAVEAVFASGVFQKTESAWQGLRALLKKAQIKGEQPVKVTIAPADHDHLETVLDAVADLSSDQLPNLVLVDLMFDNTLPNIELLEKVLTFADNMMVPVLVNMAPGFFRIDNFSQVNTLSYLSTFIDDVSYSKFRKLKSLPGAAWVVLCCNSFAVRNIQDCETVQPYAGPVWAAGAVCALSVNQNRWPTGFSKYLEFFLDGLPMADAGGSGMASTQGLIGDEKIIQMVEAGFTPVVGIKSKDRVCIPKETSLSGASIRFQMLFNRVIETLIKVKEQSDPGADPVQAVTGGLKALFVETTGEEPVDLTVAGAGETKEGRAVLQISFMPPDVVLAVSDRIEFSFVW